MIDTSVVIPVFKEDEYLRPVINELLKQTCMFRCEIILSEYNPDNSQFTRQLIREFKQISHVPIRLMEVQERGIPLAKHEGIMAARGEIICMFDADCVWSTHNDLQKMIDPIINGEAVMTNCSNIINFDGVPEDVIKKDPYLTLTNPVAQAVNFIQRSTNYTTGDPGACFLKMVYEEVGGFTLDERSWEMAFNLTPKVIWRYPGMIKNIKDVLIIQSPRRVLKHNYMGKYDKAVRKGKIIDLEAFFAEFKDV